MTKRFPIIVVGPWRSGTSAVAGALHAMGVNMGGPFHRIRQHDTYEDIALWNILHRNIAERAVARGIVAVGDFLVSQLRYWSSSKTGIYGAKHPLFCFCIPQIEQAWPGCKYVTVHRDPNESATSLGETGWFKADPLEAITIAASARDKGMAGIDHERIHAVRYDELTESPAEVIWDLAEFAGVTDAGKMRTALATIKPDMNHSLARTRTQ